MTKLLHKIPGIIRFLFYSLFVLVPLVMSAETSEMFEFNKMMLIYLGAIFVSTLYAIHYILHRPKLYIPVLVYVLFVFTLIIGLSTVVSIDRHTSIWGYYGRWNGGLVSQVAYGALVFVFIQVFAREHVMKLLNISLITSTIVILWGFPARFGGDLSCLLFTGSFTNSCWTAQFQPAIRMFSTLGQPNWMGAYLAVHFFIALFYFLNSFLSRHHAALSVLGIKERMHLLTQKLFHVPTYSWHGFLYGAYVIVCFLGLLFTRSRSSLIAVGVAILIGGILIVTQQIKHKLRLLYRAVLILLLLVSAYYGISYVSTSFASDVPAHLQITDSLTIRKIVWQGAVELGLRHPLLGTGPETFAYSYYSVKPIEHNQTSEWDFIYNKAHNEFLNYLATTGFLGFISYTIFIGVSFWYISRRLFGTDPEDSLFSLHIIMAFSTIQITNFFGFSTSTLQLFLYILPAAVYSTQRSLNNSDRMQKGTLVAAQVIIVIILGSILLWNLLSYYRADLLYKEAQREIQSEEYQNGSQLLIQAMKLKYDHLYEDKLSTALAHLALISSFNDDTGITEDLIELSRGSNIDALRASPDNIQYWRTKAKNHYLYFQITGDIKELEMAVESMKYTVVRAPQDAQSYYMLALFYTLLDQEDPQDNYKVQAQRALYKALELRPTYVEAQELLREMRNEK